MLTKLSRKMMHQPFRDTLSQADSLEVEEAIATAIA